MRQWLYDIRNGKNLSQAHVALNAKISRQYYNFIEHGERRPSPQVAKRIAKVLDFPSEGYRLIYALTYDDSEETESLHFFYQYVSFCISSRGRLIYHAVSR